MPYSDTTSPQAKEYQRKQVKKVKDWRERTKKRLIFSMGGGCQCCGYTKTHKALELHHIDPKVKEKSFRQLMAHPTAIDTWYAEFEKCILVCSNCHREIHAGIRKLPDFYKTFDKDLFEGRFETRNWLKIHKAIESDPELGKRHAELTQGSFGWVSGEAEAQRIVDKLLADITAFFDMVEKSPNYRKLN